MADVLAVLGGGAAACLAVWTIAVFWDRSIRRIYGWRSLSWRESVKEVWRREPTA